MHGVSSSHEGGGAGGGEGAVQPQQPRRLARTISTPSRYQDGILDVSLPGKKGGDDHHGSRREAPAAAEPAATAPPPVRPVVPPPEAKPQQQPQVPEGPPVCCFCHRPADEEVTPQFPSAGTDSSGLSRWRPGGRLTWGRW